MLGIMLRKLVTKKWMFACLLLGCVLLIATVVSFPLYRNAAFDKMLHDKFTEELAQTGRWPARIRVAVSSPQKTGAARLHEMEERMNGMSASLGVETKENVFFYRLSALRLNRMLNRLDTKGNLTLRLSMMTGLPEHVELLGGRMYSESGLGEDGSVEVVIAQSCMTANNLLLNEELEYSGLMNPDGKRIKIKIVGIIDDVEGDYYWEIGSGELKDTLLMNENLFRSYFIDYNSDAQTLVCSYSYLFDYNCLKSEDADRILELLKGDEEKYQGEAFSGVLENFITERKRVSFTLIILQVPVLVLLGAFLFMISGQMYELERNEISVIKSRGSSRGQIFRLYIYQSVFLTLVGALVGVPLGALFSRVLGSASNFLEFGLRRRLETRYTLEVWIYLAVVAAATVLIMAVPAIKHSKVSIVHLKQNKAVRKRSWWEMIFLDFICLGIAIYGYFNYSRSEDDMLRNVLLGKSLDPLLYLCSSLFIVGMGLLYLRLQPLLVKLVYLIGQRRWRPASYASFLESQKNGRKQQFIMLFLILTIALGSFHATVARTILQNAQNNTAYLDGSDVVIKEVWKGNLFYADSDDKEEQSTPKYYEPDIGKYNVTDFIDSYTKVIAVGESFGSGTGNATVMVNKESYRLELMGIQTREFGELTWVDRDLLEKPYYTYLNDLAEIPKGVILSRNFQTELGLDVGYMVNIQYQNTMGQSYNMELRVVDFVDYWPGYAPEITSLSENGLDVVTARQYLAVVNISELQRVCKTQQPYELWISLKDGTDMSAAGKWINENKIRVARYINKAEDLLADVENPLLQGTNGVLTMGFLVMILLCGVGYLIYWIMSIRSREMMFGVLRAFGMHKRELFQMLMLEQFFSGVLTIFAGIGIGRMVSRMFVPMLQNAYAVSNQVLPMKIWTNPSDLMRLYAALAAVMIVCLVVLIVLVVKLNVTKALKLGEE